LGHTLNVTLGGLALAIGILGDEATITIEKFTPPGTGQQTARRDS